MRIAVVSLTENGRKISALIAGKLAVRHECRRYAFVRYSDPQASEFDDLKSLTAEIFHKYDGIIFICACGIAVRMIAPHIVSKHTDPAVIAVDEQGKFAVSLLSGHIGGANALTGRLAEIIGAVPVITTATDIGGRFSPDSFASSNGLYICENEMIKEIAVAVVNGRKIGFYSDYPYVNFPEKYFDNMSETGVCVCRDMNVTPFAENLHLIPVNIKIGVGCKKNTSSELLEKFVLRNIEKNGIPIQRVKKICTVDIKRDEKAIVDFSEKYGIPIEFFTPEELMSVEGDFAHSDFVMKTTGADNICERSAALGGGRLIIRKTSENGMTFAAAEEYLIIDFERQIL